MKSDSVKAALYLAGAGVVVYVAWKAYKVGDSAAQSVSDTVKSITDRASVLYRKIIPSSVPPLESLPSSGDYPEAGPIRRAEDAADIELRIRNMDIPDLTPIALNETGREWAVAGEQQTFSPEPFDIYPTSRAASEAREAA